ncbi:target of EGR1 protein 1 isoform X2 [Pangasianodon hypophthalmus]|uniref:target of EGR1 protein 1 isoform X2 n=1 Tax=Pangasianodon hypophthalmus TaxID=310915 RepID=UPI000F00A8C7|nr:target of EGR1 protein 1 isoform X2 [Pangasianodon hypophthalmus]
MMSSSLVVPVIDVQSNNFKELWPAIVLAFKTSSFIALDTELSGLGARKALLAESIEDRYKAICHAARTRSILSLGLACYKKLEGKADSTYLVQVYNLTLLCAEEYVIEPQSVQFLVQHGFDFNKQYAQGVPYDKGNDKGGEPQGVNMRTLFVELLRANKPLVLHNGLIDMIFLYQCFYAHLPEKLGTFTADLSQMFPAGIYDTKYATEYELRFTASYLEYAYKKCKLDNSRSIETAQDRPHVFLEFCNYTGRLQSYVDYRPCIDSHSSDGPLNICIQFSAYGWCPSGSRCPMSHDTDLIIRQDEKSKEDKRKKRKRRKKKKAAKEEEEEEEDGPPQDKKAHVEDMDEDGEEKEEQKEDEKVHGKFAAHDEEMPSSETPAAESHSDPDKNESDAPQTHDLTPDATNKSPKANERKVEGGTHRAGFDAFMTGYIFAFASIRNAEGSDSWIPACANKLYLSGKSVPLHIAKSTFSKSSRAHMTKMEHVWRKEFPKADGNA